MACGCFGGGTRLNFEDDSDESEIEEATLRLKVAGLDLPKRRNPFVVLFFHQGGGEYTARRSFVGDRGVTKNTAKWAEMGRTEVIYGSSNAYFKRRFTVPYNIDELQELRIEFYSELTKTLDLTRQDFIGAAEVRVIDVLDEKNGTLKTPLANVMTKNCGSVLLTVKTQEDS